MILLEFFGWYGAAAIVGAYFFSSFGYLKPTTKVYQLLNLSGAAGIVAISVAKSTWQPAVLNAVWGTIATFALVQICRTSSRTSK